MTRDPNFLLQAPPTIAVCTASAPRSTVLPCLALLAMANELAVRTDKGEYVGGDTIYG